MYQGYTFCHRNHPQTPSFGKISLEDVNENVQKYFGIYEKVPSEKNADLFKADILVAFLKIVFALNKDFEGVVPACVVSVLHTYDIANFRLPDSKSLKKEMQPFFCRKVDGGKIQYIIFGEKWTRPNVYGTQICFYRFRSGGLNMLSIRYSPLKIRPNNTPTSGPINGGRAAAISYSMMPRLQ
ncbi:hypothetical protein AGLY_015331 [Aphis glycines]|uniref:Uncharacterized protein n=1 Tax=Aphis glycines TaxID=307491 RepID=A0A6G0T1B1_APHGL|nr:hypothetical protein AGLY_015331 [Aphis glycines]